jgi:hypothetical protein
MRVRNDELISPDADGIFGLTPLMQLRVHTLRLTLDDDDLGEDVADLLAGRLAGENAEHCDNVVSVICC